MRATQFTGSVTGKPAPKPFRYFDKGTMAVVGQGYAVLQTGKLHLKGYVAWLAWAWRPRCVSGAARSSDQRVLAMGLDLFHTATGIVADCESAWDRERAPNFRNASVRSDVARGVADGKRRLVWPKK